MIPTRLPLLALLGLIAAPNASPQPSLHVLGEGVQLACEQPEPLALECDYRLTAPGEVLGAAATLDGATLPAPRLEARARHASPVAVLMLVDTSDPARQPTLERIVDQVRAVVARAGPGYRLGLASFDSDLVLQAPIGSEAEALVQAAAKLRALGRTTELYRSTLEAVRLLAREPAGRRALYLFSDGLAEDTAYFHEDVIRAARAAGVTIYGVGYPRSVAKSVALQTLRRLSEETGGRFVEADATMSLPRAFLEDPFAELAGGGRLVVDLSPAVGTAADRLRITLTTDAGPARADVPVTLPPPPTPELAPAPAPAPALEVRAQAPEPDATPAPEPEPEPAPAAAPPASVVAPPAAIAPALALAKPLQDPLLLWYAVVAIGAVAVLTLLALVWVQRRSARAVPAPAEASPAAAPPADEQPAHPYGYLELQDGSGARFAISNTAFRIGRHSDNELTLRDSSISRHHAEIHRRRDGTFTITDLESMNGVYVNDKRVKKKRLSEGDLVELGDISLRFTAHAENAMPGEETVMLRTAPPGLDLAEPQRGTG